MDTITSDAVVGVHNRKSQFRKTGNCLDKNSYGISLELNHSPPKSPECAAWCGISQGGLPNYDA